jgi:hypothetical protein
MCNIFFPRSYERFDVVLSFSAGVFLIFVSMFAFFHVFERLFEPAHSELSTPVLLGMLFCPSLPLGLTSLSTSLQYYPWSAVSYGCVDVSQARSRACRCFVPLFSIEAHTLHDLLQSKRIASVATKAPRSLWLAHLRVRLSVPLLCCCAVSQQAHRMSLLPFDVVSQPGF